MTSGFKTCIVLYCGIILTVFYVPTTRSTSPGTLPAEEGHMTREDYSGYQFDPGEDEGSLSDLDEDISQYIATKSEVKFCVCTNTEICLYYCYLLLGLGRLCLGFYPLFYSFTPIIFTY